MGATIEHCNYRTCLVLFSIKRKYYFNFCNKLFVIMQRKEDPTILQIFQKNFENASVKRACRGSFFDSLQYLGISVM